MGRRGLVGLFVNKFTTAPRVEGSNRSLLFFFNLNFRKSSATRFGGSTRVYDGSVVLHDDGSEKAERRERQNKSDRPAGERGKWT